MRGLFLFFVIAVGALPYAYRETDVYGDDTQQETAA